MKKEWNEIVAINDEKSCGKNEIVIEKANETCSMVNETRFVVNETSLMANEIRLNEICDVNETKMNRSLQWNIADNEMKKISS